MIALVFIASNLAQVVVAGWLMVRVEITSGLGVLGAALSRAVAFDLIALFAGAAVLTVAAGRRRSLGRDFDLACVAFVPYMAVKLVAILAYRAGGFTLTPGGEWFVRCLAIAWAGYVLYLAWQQARSRAGESS